MKTEKTQKKEKRIEQSNEITKTKTRWSKEIKNALKNFKVFYQNIRGLKSKLDSTTKTISDYKTILIWLVETDVQKEEEIRIQRYSQIFRNDRSGDTGGIVLKVKENIKAVTLEVPQVKKIGQSLWILLDNNISKIRIGVIYDLPENLTSSSNIGRLQCLSRHIHRR